MKNKFKIIQPDDWHVHFREDEMLKIITQYSARINRRCIAMPNTNIPITNSVDAESYKSKIKSHAQVNHSHSNLCQVQQLQACCHRDEFP